MLHLVRMWAEARQRKMKEARDIHQHATSLTHTDAMRQLLLGKRPSHVSSLHDKFY
jgi:hypothetical protein